MVAGRELAGGARHGGDHRHRHDLGGRGRQERRTGDARTYLLVASGASANGDSLRVRAIRDAGPPLERIYQDALLPNARFTVDLGEAFPTLAGESVGVIVESMGQTSGGAVTPMPIVVERAMYRDAGGVVWAAGSNLVATRLR